MWTKTTLGGVKLGQVSRGRRGGDSLGKVLERNISPSVRMYYFTNYLCSDLMQMFCTHANTSALAQRVGDAFAVQPR